MQISETVTIQNVTRGTNGTCTTDSLGQYFYDDIYDTSVQAEEGDTIRVCTADSGTYSQSFLVQAEAEEKVINLDYILHAPPSWPYSVEGTVTWYGELKADKNITIINHSNGYSTTTTTDSEGRYLYENIYDSVIAASAGDRITALNPYGAHRTFTVADNSQEQVIDFYNNVMNGVMFQVTITPADDSIEAMTFKTGDDPQRLGYVNLAFQTRGMASFEIELINDDGIYSNLVNIGDEIEIWMDADMDDGDYDMVGHTKKFAGHIKSKSYQRSYGKNLIILSGFDWSARFKDGTTVNELYTGTRTYEDIIANANDGLLVKYAPDIQGSEVLVTGGQVSAGQIMRFDNIDLFEAITQLVEPLGDWIWQVSPNKHLQVHPWGYTDIDMTIPEFGESNMTFDDHDMANYVTVIGATDLNAMSKTTWTGNSSDNNSDASYAFDDYTTVGWDSKRPQTEPQWYKLDIGMPMVLKKMFLNNSTTYPTKFPRNYTVTASINNSDWDEIVAVGNNQNIDLIVDFPSVLYRYIKISVTPDAPEETAQDADT